MPTATRMQRSYDLRLKELVRTTGNVNIALERPKLFVTFTKITSGGLNRDTLG